MYPYPKWEDENKTPKLGLDDIILAIIFILFLGYMFLSMIGSLLGVPIDIIRSFK